MHVNDFFKLQGTKIVITDRVANVNKLMRLAVRTQSPSIRECTAYTLSQIGSVLLAAYAAAYDNSYTYKVIDRNTQSMLLTLWLKDQKYDFLPEESKLVSTSEEILRSINQIRMNTVTAAYENCTTGKIAEIKALIGSYENYLESRKEVDTAMLLSKCVEILDTIAAQPNAADRLMFLLPLLKECHIGIPANTKYTDLEKAFLEKLLQIRGVEAEDLTYSTDTSDQKFEFFRAYGIANEVRYVVDKIQENNLQYGDVAVIYAGEAYEKFLKAELDSRKMLYTFPRGFKAADTNFVQLILHILEFAASDYEYAKLSPVIKNPVLRLKGSRKGYRSISSEGIGWRKSRYLEFFTRFDKLPDNHARKSEENVSFVEFLKAAINCFEDGLSCAEMYERLLKFIRKYSDKEDFFRAVVKDELNNQKKVYRLIASTNSTENISIFTDYFRRLRCKMSESPAAISIFPYGSPEIIDRKTLFVMGLSNENIANTTAESPVLNDSELETYVTGKIDFALQSNMQKREAFENTLASFNGNAVYIGYSSYDTVSLLGSSASLLYLSLLDAHKKNTEDIEYASYDIIDMSLILSDDIDAAEIPAPEQAEGTEETPNGDANTAETNTADASATNTTTANATTSKAAYYSASSLQTLLGCPLSHYYEKVLHVRLPELKVRSADSWLAANEKGNLVHHTMERYVDVAIIQNKSTAPDDALIEKYYNEVIQEFLDTVPIPSVDIFEAEKEENFAVVKDCIYKIHEELNASTVGKQIIGCEVDFEKIKYTGGAVVTDENDSTKKIDLTYTLYFRGSVDRVDGYVDAAGTLWLQLYDYKTGNFNKKQKEVIEEKQIQHFVYAMAMLQWANDSDNKQKLEKQFGCTIKDVKIELMKYVFPFEDVLSEIDVSDTVKDANIRFPESVDSVLMCTEGNYQHDRLEAAAAYIDMDVTAKLQADPDLCKYCNYKQICRLWV